MLKATEASQEQKEAAVFTDAVFTDGASDQHSPDLSFLMGLILPRLIAGQSPDQYAELDQLVRQLDTVPGGSAIAHEVKQLAGVPETARRNRVQDMITAHQVRLAGSQAVTVEAVTVKPVETPAPAQPLKQPVKEIADNFPTTAKSIRPVLKADEEVNEQAEAVPLPFQEFKRESLTIKADYPGKEMPTFVLQPELVTVLPVTQEKPQLEKMPVSIYFPAPEITVVSAVPDSKETVEQPFITFVAEKQPQQNLSDNPVPEIPRPSLVLVEKIIVTRPAEKPQAVLLQTQKAFTALSASHEENKTEAKTVFIPLPVLPLAEQDPVDVFQEAAQPVFAKANAAPLLEEPNPPVTTFVVQASELTVSVLPAPLAKPVLVTDNIKDIITAPDVFPSQDQECWYSALLQTTIQTFYN